MKTKWWQEFDLILAALLMAILVSLTIAGVVFRYILRMPFSWLEEVQVLLIVWSAFLGSSAAFRTGQHMCMEFLHDKFSPRGKLVLDSIICVVTCTSLAFFGYNAIRLVNLYTSSQRTTSILRIPSGVIYGIIPLACLLMIVNHLCYFWQNKGKSAEREI